MCLTACLFLRMPADMCCGSLQTAARPVLAGTARTLRGLSTVWSTEAVCPEGAIVVPPVLGVLRYADP